MTRKEKTEFLRIGLALVGVSVDNRTSQLITTLYDSILIKGGRFSLSDAIDIETEVAREYAKKVIKERTKNKK